MTRLGIHTGLGLFLWRENNSSLDSPVDLKTTIEVAGASNELGTWGQVVNSSFAQSINGCRGSRGHLHKRET